MRLLALGLLVAACGSEAVPVAEPLEPWSDAWILAEGPSYLDDATFRRAALEASLTDPDNVYSATRASAYGLGDRGWDVLPVWSPRVHAVDAEVVDGEKDIIIFGGFGSRTTGKIVKSE